ncbi:hypothetical protein ATEIFO6365_0003018000 [Aspergillus terreus]|uniref:Uncharacterized protein n=1 Tax=Aspergillus terreus TaxID=33178 RepID=A0A5M3YR24_ASPTE|nr:hypothetical protein ATETN484_0003011900 [Aspergillus terreus]GFF14127.1 hypothetical protein ATEIFO6365_0003018000 [Aspergillus terreus]
MPPLRPPTSVPMSRLFRPIRTAGRLPSRALSSCHRATRPITSSARQGIALPRHAQPAIITNKTRTLATTSSGKSQGDEMVEELQELYETAKDEFEIATESTDGATIYAASDRESARDALNQLLAVYSLYTTDIASTAGSQEPEPDDRSEIVETNFDPAAIPAEVRDEVRRRVGQRVRELQNAVEVLEERAKAD